MSTLVRQLGINCALGWNGDWQGGKSVSFNQIESTQWILSHSGLCPLRGQKGPAQNFYPKLDFTTLMEHISTFPLIISWWMRFIVGCGKAGVSYAMGASASTNMVQEGECRFKGYDSLQVNWIVFDYRLSAINYFALACNLCRTFIFSSGWPI